MNAPDRSTSFICPDDVDKVQYRELAKMQNCAEFCLQAEDHTLGNVLRMQLFRDPSVTFAAYQHPHPLRNDIIIKIQTNNSSNPRAAFKTAVETLQEEVMKLSSDFERLVQEKKKADADEDFM